MELPRILEDPDKKMSSALSFTSVTESLKTKNSLTAKRLQFQQRRTKSAIEIATDFLIQTKAEIEPETSDLEPSALSTEPTSLHCLMELVVGGKKEDDKDRMTSGRPWTTERYNGTSSDGVASERDSPKSSSAEASSLASASTKSISSEEYCSKTSSPGSRHKSTAAKETAGDPSGVRRVGNKNLGPDENHNTSQSENTPMKSIYFLASHPLLPPPPAPVTSSRGKGREENSQQQQEQQPRKSWRKAIFERVCTTLVHDSSLLYSAEGDANVIKRKKKSAEVRARWKKATLETLLILRLNKDQYDSEDQECCAEHRLGYVELSPCLKDVRKIWEDLLKATSSGTPHSLSYDTLLEYVKKGIPSELRGVVWKLLALQQSCQTSTESCVADMYEVPYTDLLDRFTADQHAILIDLGRTFPGHPYFAKPLGQGQLELFNLLKAYSLLDEEVGYCQGISFIAGLLLMHMEETAAFEMIRHLMLGLGFRTQYSPSMTALQLKLYQMVRLIHDRDRQLYNHLEKYEVAPALYATPWFLTLFASQYPLCFVARVFDMIFIQGPDVIFKVALMLVMCHRELILQLDCFEELVDFLKTGLPEMAQVQVERVTGQAFELDVSRELHTYEVEFHVFREEMLCSFQLPTTGTTTTTHSTTNNHNSNILTLQHTVLRLRQENRDLMDQLERVHSQAHTLRMASHQFRLNEDKFKAGIRALELERSALLTTVSKLKMMVPDNKEEEDTPQ